jgi:hypothetical protein
MFRQFLRAASAAALLCLLVMPSRSADETLIPAGSSWRFNDKGTNLGTAWRAAGYNDSAWVQGNAQLGYGDGDEATVLGFGSSSNRYITYYFRRTFTVADLNNISALTLRYLRDDGCVIYVNGVEVVRSNMPSGTITSSTRATASIGNADETTWLQTALSKATLVTGQNTIAVEIHKHGHQLRSRIARHHGVHGAVGHPTFSRKSERCELDERDFQRQRHGINGSGERNAPPRLVSANRDTQRSGPSRGCADHRRHTHDAERERRVTQRRWPVAPRSRLIAVPGSGRLGACGLHDQLRDPPVELHQFRKPDAGLPADGKLVGERG